MQQTSEAYKTEQKQHLREKSYVWVYLGVVDRTAQKTATITSDVTDWSKLPTGNDLIEGVYATYEQNFFRADGEMMFPPETWAMYQGAASADLIDPNVQNSAAITFTFGSNCDIRGLTLKFYDDAIPLEFTVTNGKTAGTHSYVYDPDDVDEHGNWSCESEFMDSDYITIIPTQLKGGTQRFRIQRILFGVGFYFSDKDLLSTSFTNTVSHLSDKLPSKTFSFTIDNTSRKFSADDPHSFVHFLQEQQEVDFDYGRELPDGTIETIKGGKTYLKTWTTDEQKATFTSVGYLEFMDSTYYQGRIDDNSGGYKPSLYEYAQRIFTDAGITQYNLDSSLQDIKTYVPLPVEKHKNLLQLIANAGRCLFYEDRDGILTIAPSLPGGESYDVGYTLEYKDLLTPPKVGTTDFIKNVVCHYYDYTYGNDEKELAVIENPVMGNNIVEFSKPVIVNHVNYTDREVTYWEYVVTGIDINGGDSFIFSMSHGNYEYYINGTYYSGYKSAFKYVDKCDKIEIVNSADNVVYKRSLNTSTIDFINTSSTSFTDLKVKCYKNGYEGIAMTENTSYRVEFEVTRLTKIIVYGLEVAINDSEVSTQIRNIGVDRTCRNPLITSKEWAIANRDWMADYYDDDVEYDLDYRGEPALDCDDQIYLENEFVAKNHVRITDGTINTAQGMTTSKLKARRLSYHEYAKVDVAQVDIGEIK